MTQQSERMTEAPDDHNEYDDDAMICPITGQICMTENDEFCEDYGCARQAGIDVDRLIP